MEMTARRQDLVNKADGIFEVGRIERHRFVLEAHVSREKRNRDCFEDECVYRCINAFIILHLDREERHLVMIKPILFFFILHRDLA